MGLFHAHGCLTCARRYQDTCAHPLKNRNCPTCLDGRPPTQEDIDRLPQSCCAESRLLTDVDELSRYNLGGPGPWFRCLRCSRTHPFSPEETP